MLQGNCVHLYGVNSNWGCLTIPMRHSIENKGKAKLSAVRNTEQPSAVHQVGHFIFEGDTVRVLTPGKYRDKEVTFIQILETKVSRTSRL